VTGRIELHSFDGYGFPNETDCVEDSLDVEFHNENFRDVAAEMPFRTIKNSLIHSPAIADDEIIGNFDVYTTTNKVLCERWEKNVAAVRFGGEKSASGSVIAGQFFPCACAMRDSMINEIRRGYGDDGDDICRCVAEAFDGELATYEKLKFTTRMKYMAMDDFLFLQRVYAMREFGCCNGQGVSEPVDCILFSGGGVKGIGFAPLGEIFSSREYEDVISEDCKFAGTSAGAMVAAMCAFGVVDIAKPIRGLMDISLPLGRDANLLNAYPAMAASLDSGFCDCLKPIELIDRYIATEIRQFLRSLDENDLQVLDEDELERVRLLSEPYDILSNREPHMARFSDISMLRKLPGGIGKFHWLAISMWNCGGEKTVFASAETTPDFQVAYAIRISIAMPTLMRRVRMAIPGLDDPNSPCTYSDGGTEQNMPDPAKAFGADGCRHPLFCTLDNDGEAYSGVERNTFIPYFPWLFNILSMISKASGRMAKNFSICSGEDCLIVPHATVSTTQFWVNEIDLLAATHQASLAAKRKLEEMRGLSA
jgi:hypothetical protein